mmetsp:Transcript_18295/g.26193  ORF Transcript_18295/g.26193 Transcript_18295/m.26193 type:complete len:455 (+) Transcript_18295:40-1404(+)
MVSIQQPRLSTSKPNRHLHLLQNLYQHLCTSLGTDVRDGTADIALSVSMIFISTQEECHLVHQIMNLLTHIASLEIIRKSKKSRKAVEILVICEKLAAAGCDTSPYFSSVLKAASVSLPTSLQYETLSTDLTENRDLTKLNFWSSRSLLWLWRKGHLFHKVSKQDCQNALTVEELLDTPPMFHDMSLPLVIDVGCGLGVTLIGLAAKANGEEEMIGTTTNNHDLNLNWSKYNYLGSDLSSKAMQWATSLTLRRKLDGRCQFLHASTETVLEYLNRSNSVEVKMILLQFPTPYRLLQEKIDDDDDEKSDVRKKNNGCNEKLPLGPDDPSFMANPRILEKMVHLINRRPSSHCNEKEAYLLLQSNCEDVALYIHDYITSKHHLEAIASAVPRLSFNGMTFSSRTKTWLQNHHAKDKNLKRALGQQWSCESMIPIMTETEALCLHQSTPVHRCLFKK